MKISKEVGIHRTDVVCFDLQMSGVAFQDLAQDWAAVEGIDSHLKTLGCIVSAKEAYVSLWNKLLNMSVELLWNTALKSMKLWAKYEVLMSFCGHHHRHAPWCQEGFQCRNYQVTCSQDGLLCLTNPSENEDDDLQASILHTVLHSA